MRHRRFSILGILAASVFLLAPVASLAADGLKLTWQTNVLQITGDKLPGGQLDVWWGNHSSLESNHVQRPTSSQL